MDRDLRIRMLLEAGDRVTRPLRDMRSGASGLSGEIRQTRESLRQLDRAQRDIGAFRQLKAGLRSTEQELQAAQARVDQLGRHMREAGTPTRELNRDFARARAEAQRLGQQHRVESTELQRIRDRLREAGIETRNLGRHQRDLRDATDRTNRELQEQERRLQRVTARSERMAAARERFGRVQAAGAATAATGAAAIGMGVATAQPLLASDESAREYQSTMTDIAQKANLGRVESAKMGRELLTAAKAANQFPKDMQAGVDALAGLGAEVPDAVAMMLPIGRAATAYKAEIADLANAAYAAKDNLKVAVQDTGRMIDAMAQAGKSGAFEIKDMAQYFPALTAAYQGLGQSGLNAGADLAAAAQITRKGAGDSATAATNLANVLQKINSPATIRAFKKNFGVDLPAALQEAYRKGKTPIEALAEITNKTLKGDLSKLGFLFEDAQVQAGLRPLIQNMDLYRQIRADAIKAANEGTVTNADFADRMQDSAEKAKRMAINGEALSVVLGTLLLPAADAVREKIAGFADWLARASEKYPNLMKGAVIAAAVLSALFVVFGIGAVAIAAIMGPIAILNAGLIAMGVAGGTASIGLLPIIATIGAIVLAIAALAAAAYLIYNNWGAITQFFTDLWNSITGIVSSIVSDITTAFDGGLWGVIALLVQWSTTLLGTFFAIGSAVMPKLMEAIGAGVSWAIGAVPSILGGLVEAIKFVIWNGLLLLPRLALQFGINTVQGFLQGMFSAFGALKNGITSMAGNVVAWFKEKLGIHSPSRVFAALGGFVTQGLANGIAGGEREPVQRIRTMSDKLTRALAVGASMPGVAIGAGAAAPPAPVASPPAPITIHIYGAQGQSPQDMGKAVAAELRRLGIAGGSGASYDDPPDWS